MQAININVKGIKCDKCEYRDDTAKLADHAKYLNMPCPLCGTPLLTQKDLTLLKQLTALTDLVNCFFEPEEEGAERIPVRVEMDGTGKATLRFPTDA
jgi:hypothetical protein